MDAWQKGDVSSALAKLGVVLELDRKAPDFVNRESGARYQSFYNEVRSEHDAMNTAYAEARKQLADRNFAKAIATLPGVSREVSDERDFPGAALRHRRAAAAGTICPDRAGRPAG